ncbi:MAG TPA: type II secretion system protein [Phycisphaerales bacterium]|nr:type II secretion system protein [Phycisphaerales bacterium]
MRARTRRAGRLGYTLIEVLVVVTVLGIAAAMVVPSISSASVLRVQGAIRTLVSDIAIAQSDAIAYQKGRAIVFFNDPDNPRYVVCEVNGPTLDLTVDTLREQRVGGEQFGFASFDNINLPNNMLVVDELGGPVMAPGDPTPAPAGSIDIVDPQQRFRVNIEAYTGKVTVTSLPR